MGAGHDTSGSVLSLPELSDLLHTLPGFLLVLTSEGKLLHLSDNVAEHLGHSMVRNINVNVKIIITICQVHVEHFVIISALFRWIWWLRVTVCMTL